MVMVSRGKCNREFSAGGRADAAIPQEKSTEFHLNHRGTEAQRYLCVSVTPWFTENLLAALVPVGQILLVDRAGKRTQPIV